MSRWLVTGSHGMLGRDLVTLLTDRGEQVTGLGHSELDLVDADAVGSALRKHQPDVVVNCAAWTAVDDAEANEQQALLVNGRGPAHLASTCEEIGCRFVQLSTDYVFDGRAKRPYEEDDMPRPRSAYGRTKLAGERAVLEKLPDSGYVIRTAWLYGEHGANFIRTMIRQERKRSEVHVVDDQVGQPTWTADVAAGVFDLMHLSAPAGVYHLTSAGETSWHGLAQEVFRLLGADPNRVLPTTTESLGRPASRPAYSVLGCHKWSRAGLECLDGWQRALDRAFPALAAAELEINES